MPLFVIVQNENFGFINENGDVKIPPKFTGVGQFSEGIAVANISDTQCGLINENGEFIVAPTFTKLGAIFCEGLLAAQENNLYGYIDRAGRFAIPPQFHAAMHFSDGMACVRIGNLYGFIDRSGRVLIPPRFEQISVFRKGRAPFEEHEKRGFIDKSGQVLIPAIYSKSTSTAFFQEVATVCLNGFWGLINIDGGAVLEPKLAQIGSMKEGIASFQNEKNGKYGFLNVDGNVECIPNYDKRCEFEGEFASVKVGEDWWVIDRQFKRRGSFRCDAVFQFSEGMAEVEIDGGIGYIDTSGSLRIPPKYTETNPFQNGLAKVFDHKIRYYVNKDGEEVWRSK